MKKVLKKLRGTKKSKAKLKYQLIKDKYYTYDELEQALRNVGVEATELIVGVDFTKSNKWQGGKPYYNSNNLHDINPYPNPYQRVLSIMAKSLAKFDNDLMIPAFGFGDSNTTNKSVFPFLVDKYGNGVPCHKLEGVLNAYGGIITQISNGTVTPSGPTNFGPLIRKAIEITKESNSYHILLIICDGAVINKKDTIKAICEASKYPLSIICIGVGKGPWDLMEEFDDEIKGRDFDNFQFVDFHKIMKQVENEEVEFAKHALQEIPDQWHYIRHYVLKF